MKPKSLRHLTHYLFLLAFLTLGTVSMVILGKNTFFKAFIITLMALTYFTWGVIHHYLEKDLHLHIIIEYLLFSVLGAGTVLGVLFYL